MWTKICLPPPLPSFPYELTHTQFRLVSIATLFSLCLSLKLLSRAFSRARTRARARSLSPPPSLPRSPTHTVSFGVRCDSILLDSSPIHTLFSLSFSLSLSRHVTHTWMRHSSHMNESRHTHMNDHVIHMWMSHVTHIWMSHVTHTWMHHTTHVWKSNVISVRYDVFMGGCNMVHF